MIAAGLHSIIPESRVTVTGPGSGNWTPAFAGERKDA